MLARSLRSCWLLTGLPPLNCPPLGLQYWGHRAGEVSAVMLLCDPGKPVTSGSFHWMKRGEFIFAKLDRVAETGCCARYLGPDHCHQIGTVAKRPWEAAQHRRRPGCGCVGLGP